MIRWILPLLVPVTSAHSLAAQPAAIPGGCHAGSYAMADGSYRVITPSDAPNLRYRTLDGRSGKLFPVEGSRYESADGWSARTPVTLRVEFGACGQGTVRFEAVDGPALEGRRVALPVTPVRFESGDASLYGVLILPADTAPRAVAVLQYGSGRESAVTFNALPHVLALQGIAAFVFDKRGTGRSTGEFSADAGTLADDMVAAVAAARTHAGGDGLPLGVLGESQGGWVAPLAAARTPVDFLVVSYGLAVSMLEEDRQEVAQSLARLGYGADVLAMGEELHRAAARVMISRFQEGLDEMERLKAVYGREPWFAHLGGDFTQPLTSTPTERIPELKALFDFPFDLEYDPLPILESLPVPQLWLLAGEDTEAPHEATLTILRGLQARGMPIEVIVFPDAEHGMIAVEPGPEGPRFAGRHADGYFEFLTEWILAVRPMAAPSP